MTDAPEVLDRRLADVGFVLHVQADDGVGAYVTDKRGSMIWSPSSDFVSVADDLAEAEEWLTARELRA